MKQRRLPRIIINKRPNMSTATAAGRLDANHICPGISQQLARDLAQVPDLENSQSFERTFCWIRD